MGPPGLERAAQRSAGTQQMRLSDVFLERSGSQAIGQRSVGTVADRAHLLSRPITSTPGGGENVNRSGMSLGFLTGCVNASCVI